MKRKFDHSDSEDGDSDAPEEVGRQHGSGWQRQQQHQHPSSSQEHEETDAEASGSEQEEDEDESSEDFEQQEQALEQQLADIPFEVLEKLNRDGKGPTPAAARAAALEAKHKVFHRETKNRPQEVSSKKPVSRFREVIQVPKQ
jgi:ribosomal RNA-processing protein 36